MRFSFKRWKPSQLPRSRTKHADEIAAGSRKTERELSAAEPRIGIIETSTSTSTRRAREES